MLHIHLCHHAIILRQHLCLLVHLQTRAKTSQVRSVAMTSMLQRCRHRLQVVATVKSHPCATYAGFLWCDRKPARRLQQAQAFARDCSLLQCLEPVQNMGPVNVTGLWIHAPRPVLSGTSNKVDGLCQTCVIVVANLQQQCFKPATASTMAMPSPAVASDHCWAQFPEICLPV